ncbi:MAG: hypothetical protein ACI8ZM_003379 [Crocinitomix sp.]|jgi:hypothetical protein
MADNEKKEAFVTRSKESHERQMDIIMNLLRENHQLKQVCIEIYRGIGESKADLDLLDTVERILGGEVIYED